MSKVRDQDTTLAFLLAGALAFAFGCGGDGSGGGGNGADAGGGGGSGDGGGAGGGGEPDAGGGGLDLEWPATPDDYAAELPTYVNTLVIPGLDNQNVPTCCKDFGDISKNGSGAIDNGLAGLEDTISSIPDASTLQESITDGIADGDLVLLFDHLHLSGDPDDFVLAQFLGAFDEGTTFENASAGSGEFLILRDSFAGETGEPQVYFDPASISGGAVSAGPDQMAIEFPFSGTVLSLIIREAEIGGDATVGASGVAYDGGTLSGYINLDDFFGALNAVLNSPECDCLVKDGDVYVDDGGWESDCNNDASACPEGGVCETLGAGEGFFSVCTLLPGLINDEADIDLNDNTADGYEALSVGFQWTGVEATVTGVSP